MSPHVTRRSLIRGLGGAALFAALPGPLLAACSTQPAGTSAPSSNAKVRLPSHLPYAGVKPDLAPTTNGVDAGYLTYPADPAAAITQPPGRGGTVTAMTLTYGAVPPAVGQNAYWQELNKRLGATLNLNIVPNADYANKLTTVVAGGDLPDMVFFFAALKPPQFPALLRAKFQDLSEFLGGDAVKEYPFLANIPTPSWRNVTFNGGIYGIPVPRGIVGTVMFVRDDLIREKGLQRQPGSFEEFRELCKALTDTKRNRWALGQPDTLLPFLEQMSGAPNMWQVENGTFTHHYETEQAKQAISDMLTLFKDGVFHPDSIGSDTVQVKQWLQGGSIAVNRDGFAAWASNAPAGVTDPENYVGAILPPGRDGGQGVHWAGGGALGLISLRKAGKERIAELLRICDWLAAPFGTAEHRFRKYGVQGVHHEPSGSDLTLTELGKTEVTVPINYLTDSPQVLYTPGMPALTKTQHAFQQQLVALAVPDPSIGLFSETLNSKLAQLDKHYTDTLRDIYAGRKPFSAWDEAVREWRSRGGDQIKAEFAKAYEEANG
ncbi:putative aldouronate transport system substrate-binding protein [Thermocatellispora tengchongensis]|uniref:Putative aldouronate transport system substrate-binding protein n=1 Tax=Thermocatellispora tengchongensis TaxID=1073253 RepID=A0A840P7F0_9ACTN|nr:extracellular solute-binding protein [Thermocatellispora tengchongensis]MBB5133781.1 putative aldouronate transport system substrate-binding protein [Thermocatellispora tengchongensis]